MENKEKRKRRVSILTVFIWLALIVTMSVVAISGMNRSNALEESEVETRKVTIKLDATEYFEWQFEKLDENAPDEQKEWYKNYVIRILESSIKFSLNGNEINGNLANFTIEDNIATYEVDMPSDMENIDIKIGNFGLTDKLRRFYIEEDGQMIEYCYYSSSSYETVFRSKINDNKELYEFTLKRIKPIRINIGLPEGLGFEFWRNLKAIDYSNKKETENAFVSIVKDESIVSCDAYLLYNEILCIRLYNKNYAVVEEGYLLNSEERGYINFYKNITSDNENKEYNFEIIEKKNTDLPEIYSSIKWKDYNQAELKFNSKNRRQFYPEKFPYSNYQEWPYFTIFSEKLNDEFVVSDEYENNPKWLIVNEEDIINTELKFGYEGWDSDRFKEYYDKLMIDLENNQELPKYIFATFFKYYDELVGGHYIEFSLKNQIRYIYIKDKNIIYYVTDQNDVSESINLKYKYDNKNIDNIKYNFSTKITYFYRIFNGSSSYSYLEYLNIPINQKEIKYGENEKTEIVVNKLVNEEEGNKTYYVGLFENKKEEVTDKVYNLETKNGIGNVKIDIENYDKSKEYYIYEVDANGKKIEDSGIKYSKNRVLENENIINRYNVLSDKDSLSAVSITTEQEEDLRVIKNVELGEEYYIDNSLIKNEINQDTVTIKVGYEEDVHIVKYETEHHGKLEGDTEEVVREGNKPVNVPKVIENENYEFEKWVVIKDGEEIEVNPEEYAIFEDTTFIAKYKEIKVVDKIDTSDINVWLYVGIAIISVICVIIVVISLRLNKKRKTT